MLLRGVLGWKGWDEQVCLGAGLVLGVEGGGQELGDVWVLGV